MSRILTENIKLELSKHEALSLGLFIKEGLLDRIERSYKYFDRETFYKRESSLIDMCGDLLTAAHGHNYYKILEQEIIEKFKEAADE